MMRNSDRRAYAWSIVLFTVSFGYYIFFSFFTLFSYSGLGRFLPDDFGRIFDDIFGDFVLNFFFSEAAVLPMQMNFVLTIVLTVVLLTHFWNRFRLGAMLFTAAAPIVLLMLYGIAVIIGRVRFPWGSFWTSNLIFGSITLIVLTAYAVGFYCLMHREWEYLQMQAALEHTQ